MRLHVNGIVKFEHRILFKDYLLLIFKWVRHILMYNKYINYKIQRS